jgi:hypothetical protein
MNSQCRERRRSARHPFELGVATHLAVKIEPNYCQAFVRNISQGGISLLLSRRIEPQAIIALELTHGQNRFKLRTAMQICYVIEVGNGDYILGGPFLCELDEDDLRTLLEDSLPAPSVVVIAPA